MRLTTLIQVNICTRKTADFLLTMYPKDDVTHRNFDIILLSKINRYHRLIVIFRKISPPRQQIRTSIRGG